MTSMLACGACGALAPTTARFCAQCGVRLSQNSARDDASVGHSHVERRQLTVMFCDLVGSTRLSLELDAEEFTEAISAYRDTCAVVVKRWRGFVARYVGDGVLVYFGFPRAAEDDALRAVAAAWELSHEIPRLGLSAGSGGGGRRELRLQSRIGLHTGLVVVGDVIGRDSHENAGVLGAAPNIAARLQTLCQPEGVVVSDATAALLPPTITLIALDPPDRAELGAVRPFRVTDVPPEPMARRPLSSSGFVGRQETVQKLALAFRESFRPVAVFACGEAGIGKSRLMYEVIAGADLPNVRWIRVACSSYGQLSPLYPFREWMRDAEAGEGPGSPDAAGEQDITPYNRRRKIFRDLRETLLAQSPCVALLIEDLHWADSTTEEFLAELLAAKPANLAAVLMTSREPPHESLGSYGTLKVEMLERLAPGDAASLARSIETARPLTAFEVAEIVRHADGVPLFIEEFVRSIGIREPGGDGIPITLRDSLMGALDMLGTARAVTLCASVLGRRFEIGQLQALLELGDAELTEALTSLIRARVLVQIGEMPEASFEFRHALLRDTAYHTLLKSERMRWHRRVAELAAAGTLTFAQTMPEVLATHHSLGGNRRDAIKYWLQAQDRAMERSAHVEALAHIRSGLEECRSLTSEDREESEKLELALLRRQVQPLIAISGWSTPELETIYARAMQLCGASGPTDVKFELERGLYNMHLLRGDLRTADTIADRLVHAAREEAQRNVREKLLLIALQTKALPSFYRREFSEAKSWLSEMLSIYDPIVHAGHALAYGGDPVMLANSYLAWIDAAQGDAASALARCEAAIEHARAERHVFSVCYALCFAASAAQLCGDLGRAGRLSAEALQLGNQHNFQYWIAWAQAIEGWIVGQSSPRRGIELIDGALHRYQATGSTLVIPYFEALACRTARIASGSEASLREAKLRERYEKSDVRFWRDVLLAPIS